MVIDASAAVPWFIETPLSRISLPYRRLEIVAPAMIVVETANALMKYVRASHLRFDDVQNAVEAMPAMFDELIPDSHLLGPALAIAHRLQHKVYDCLYMALALERRLPLATADRRLADLARAEGIKTSFLSP